MAKVSCTAPTVHHLNAIKSLCGDYKKHLDGSLSFQSSFPSYDEALIFLRDRADHLSELHGQDADEMYDTIRKYGFVEYDTLRLTAVR